MKRWPAAWKMPGVDALAAKPHLPRATKLSGKEDRQLVEMLLAGLRAAGCGNDLWTCARGAALVRKQFRATFHPDQLGWVLLVNCWARWQVHRSAARRIAVSGLQCVEFE
ncbi:MAG TPA: hypothetical protein PJ982_02225 [Lacipirellulaceae bacterium]|nr:hypothetical protein [Lacipirellulaceae bacterium]